MEHSEGKVPNNSSLGFSLMYDLYLNTLNFCVNQAQWNIQSDVPKNKTLKIMNNGWKQYKSTLKTEFMEKGKNPVGYYKWLKQEDWDAYQVLKSTEEFQVSNSCQIYAYSFSICTYLSKTN